MDQSVVQGWSSIEPFVVGHFVTHSRGSGDAVVGECQGPENRKKAFYLVLVRCDSFIRGCCGRAHTMQVKQEAVLHPFMAPQECFDSSRAIIVDTCIACRCF